MALILSSDLPAEIASRSDINRLINSVSALAERYCRRTFAREVDRVEKHDGGDWLEIFLRLTPIVSIKTVTVDGLEMDSSDYTYDAATGRLRRGNGYVHPEFENWFPAGMNNVVVTYTGGYTTIPDEIKEACVQGVVQLVAQKNRDFSLQSESFADYSWSAGNASQGIYGCFPPSALLMLKGYRRSGKSVLG